MLTILENGFHFSKPDKKSQLHFSKMVKTGHLVLENFSRVIAGFHMKTGDIGYVGEFQSISALKKNTRDRLKLSNIADIASFQMKSGYLPTEALRGEIASFLHF